MVKRRDGAVPYDAVRRAPFLSTPNSGETTKPAELRCLPKQPWLDGFSIGEGLIRQFVAMPLGNGYTVEEQLTGKAYIGGIQV